MCKTYQDLFYGDNGIIKNIKNSNNDKFIELFGADFDADVFDNYILFQNGNYVVFQNIETYAELNSDYAKKISDMILFKYYNFWINAKSYCELNNDILNNYNTTVKETNTEITTQTESQTENKTGKTTGYNSNNFINDNQNTTDYQNNITENKSNEHSRQENGYKNKNIIKSKQDALDFGRVNIYLDIIKNDIIKMLCYTVY